MLAKSDRYLIVVQVSVAFLYLYAKNAIIRRENIRENRELRRILENFGEGPLEKNPCLAFSSYFCTRRRYKAKTGMVLAYLESSPYFSLL